MSEITGCLDCGKERIAKGSARGARGLCHNCYYKLKRRGTALPPKRNQSFEEHLAAIVPDENGCWLWPGSVSPRGYGSTGKHTPAHVASYRYHVGPVPRGREVGHGCHDNDLSCQDWRTCLHRRCINPEHLVAQTRSENLLARPWVKSRCIRGHQLTPENVYVIPASGSRQCLACKEMVAARYRDRRNALRRAATRQAAIAKRQFVRPVPGMPEPRPVVDSPAQEPSETA